MQRRTFISASLGLGLLGGAAMPWLRAASAGSDSPGRSSPLQMFTGAGLAFGTTVSVKLMHDDEKVAARAIEDALNQIKGIDRLMSLYRPDSQVSVLNRQGYLDRPDARLVAVLRQTQELARLTEGAFDITVQPLWSAYSTAAARGEQPTSAQIDAATRTVGWRKLSIDSQAVRFAQPDMAVTLNGIAQGYATDLALAAIKKHGIRHALLDAGEFAALGKPAPQRPWTLGVRNPRDNARLAATLPLEGRSMATSGDYEMRFAADFSSHHIVDPATGRSPLELASVSVLAPSGMLADGLSTACFVMGTKKALALCEAMPGVDALLIAKSGQTWRTAALSGISGAVPA